MLNGFKKFSWSLGVILLILLAAKFLPWVFVPITAIGGGICLIWQAGHDKRAIKALASRGNLRGAASFDATKMDALKVYILMLAGIFISGVVYFVSPSTASLIGNLTPLVNAVITGTFAFLAVWQESSVITLREKVAAIQPKGTPGSVPDVVLTHTAEDVSLIYDHVVVVLKETFQNPSKNIIAASYLDFVQAYDIRPITERSERVLLMIALVDKAFELLKPAWEEFKLPVPSPEVCTAPAHHMFELKKAYQLANNQVCGDPVYNKMRAMLGDFNEIYELQYGLAQMKDRTVDWSVLGWSGPVGIGLIREAWPKML